MENFTAYEENTYTEVEAAENLAEIVYMMEELGMFRDNHDDHGDHMSLDSFDVSSWDSANDLEQIVNWYNDQYYHHDSHTDMTVDDFLAMCEGISDEVNEEVAQCVLDEALSMMPDHDDHHGDEHESKIYDNCRVSTDPNSGYYEYWMEDWLDSEGTSP